MFNFFKKKEEIKTISIHMPIEGQIIDITDVPDQVFSQKIVGDGFAVIPEKGVVYAPCDAEVILQPQEKHAVGLRALNGAEILIHFGMDTVNLKGEGFHSNIKQGDHVKQGDIILTVDLEQIKDKVPSIATPIIITNKDDYILGEINKTALCGDVVMEISKK